MVAGPDIAIRILTLLQRYAAWIWTIESAAGLVIFALLKHASKKVRLRLIERLRSARSIAVLNWFERLAISKFLVLLALFAVGIASLIEGMHPHAWTEIGTLVVLLLIPAEFIFLGYMAWRLLKA